MSSNRFTFYLALFFLLVINVPLNLKLIDLVLADPNLDTGFVLSLPVFFISVFFLIFWFFAIPRLLKPVSILIVLASSIVSYSMYSYGVVFDYSMIQNVFETNYGEANAYLNREFVLWLIGMGIVPSILIARAKIRYKRWPGEMLHKTVGFIGAVGFIGILASLYYADYSAFGRNNAYLSKMIIPTEYLAATYKYVDRNLMHEPPAFEQIGLDATIPERQTDKPELMVLVLGETARSQNYQANGYSRETNMFTQDQGLISFQSVESCGTATAVSVPCMFSRMSQQSFDDRKVRYQDNVIDVLSHAGINILWLENDGGCKGVCDRVETWTYNSNTDSPWCESEFCDDLILLDEFDRAVSEVNGVDAVIVLHLNGSHGPTYFERYGERFRHFMPDCQRSDIQNCTDEEIVNSYDNTILHTDYLISELIKKARTLDQAWNTSLVYISDHGESLGENGIYLHGMPYSLAPLEQRSVPWMFWLSDGIQQADALDMSCIAEQARSAGFSQDNLFDTLLGLMDVETQVYNASMDTLAPCRSEVFSKTALSSTKREETALRSAKVY